MSLPKNPVLMAVIGAAHGIRGDVRVKTFTADPKALGDYGPLFAADGRRFDLVDIRPAGTVAVVHFKGVDARDAAEELNGTELFVDRSALPQDEEEDEFYHADLIGLAVHDNAGAVIGKVLAVQNFGGGDILDLMIDGKKGVLIPFSRAAVPEVSVAGGFVRIDAAAAGLVGDNEDQPDGEPSDTGFDAKRRPRGPSGAGGNR